MKPFDDHLKDAISECGVISVLVIDDPNKAVPLAKALLHGGINVMELTFRTDAALDALSAITSEVPEMIVGAGTVLTEEQVIQAKDAGAKFAVSPGFNRNTVEAAMENGLSFAPGIATPSDIEGALELGCKLLKYFPAETSGGLKNLKNIAAPFAHLGVQYIPLGGINADNVKTYLADRSLVPAVGGSWIAPRDAIDRENWDLIAENAKAAKTAIAQ